MAGIALHLSVCGPEREFCVSVVIEEDGGPLILLVASFAFSAIPASVNVLNLVAIDARSADPLVAFADVASGARDGAVRTLQWELGFVVVERLDASPLGFAVTIAAGLPKTPLMRIDRFMTIKTASGRVAKLNARQVTAVAYHRLVCIPKREICKLVVECFAVKENNVSVSSLVIGVTMDAFLFRSICLTPMKSLGQLTICGNFFVAAQT